MSSANRKPVTPGVAALRSAGTVLPGTPEVKDNKAREFEFTPADFEQVRKLIYDHAGIVLSATRQDMVYSRLARRLRVYGDHSFSSYLGRLKTTKGEWEAFVNALTTNLTSFFRENHHFSLLINDLKRLAAEKRTIKIWCCAASTGEEPYSLAMTACEAFDSLTPPVQIFASDIDTAVLAQAKAGVYTRDRLESVPVERIRKFFQACPTEGEGAFRIRPELQRLIQFSQVNLLDRLWPSIRGPVDIIFCRNVMIYFDKPTQLAILKKFVPLLRPDGLLFVGHSESLLHAADLFQSRGRTVYVRADTARMR